MWNFAKYNATVSDVSASIVSDVSYRKCNNSDVIIILSVGMNDTKSVDTARNYLSTLSEYIVNIEKLFNTVMTISNKIMFVGYTPVNEKLTTPKMNPFTGKKSFFINERIREFDETCNRICASKNISHVKLFDSALALDWDEYLTDDGLHPSDKGHRWIYEKVWLQLKDWL